MATNDYFDKHRFLGKLNTGINNGYSLFYLYGQGVYDYHYFDDYLGIRKLKNTLFLYLINNKKYDYFVHIKDGNIFFYNDKGEAIETNDLFGRPTSIQFGVEVSLEDNDNDEEGTEKAQKAAEEGSFDNNLSRLEDAILKKNKKIAIYFDGFEWIAGLYSGEKKLDIIKKLKYWNEAKNAIIVVTIKNPELLKEFDFDVDDDSPAFIYLGNPSANEIKDAFLRYSIRKKTDIEILDNELEDIVSAVQSSKKTLREAVRVLKNILAEDPPALSFKLFENTFKKPIEEKVTIEQVKLQGKVKDDILRTTNLFRNKSELTPKGIILYGPPGTGKTYIAKAIANEYNINFLAPTLADLKGEYVGQSSGKVKRIFEEARSNAPTILFLDELDTIFTPRGSDKGDSYVTDMVNQFLVEIDGVKTGKQEIFIIGATNRLQSVDSAILSRLQPQIEIPLPEKEVREKIIDSKFKKFKISEQPWKENILNKTKGMSGRDLDNLVKLLKELVKKDESELAEEDFEIVFKHFEELFISLFKKDLNNSIEIKKDGLLTYNDIIGFDSLKNELEGEVQYILADADKKSEMKKFGIIPKRGTLMYGPPGNGKTSIAEALAGEYEFYFIKILSRDFSSPIPETMLKRLDLIFNNSLKLANMSTSKKGVILFFDEVDTLIDKNMNRVVRGTLLNHFENKNGIKNHDSKVVLIAATNLNVANLDEAAVRAGRFDSKIIVNNPSKEEGIQILKSFFDKDATVRTKVTSKFYKDEYEKIINMKQLDLKKEQSVSVAELKDLYNRIKMKAYNDNGTDNGKIFIKS